MDIQFPPAGGRGAQAAAAVGIVVVEGQLAVPGQNIDDRLLSARTEPDERGGQRLFAEEFHDRRTIGSGTADFGQIPRMEHFVS